MQNIFQDNSLIRRKIKETLQLPDGQYEWQITGDIYFQTFFYLSKRFGEPEVFDDYKNAGTWRFAVKQYQIHVYLNCSWVVFLMFGKIGNQRIESPALVKWHRRCREVSGKLLYGYLSNNDRSENTMKIVDALFEQFVVENSIDKENITKEEFDDKYGMAWFDYCQKYNNKIINLNRKELDEKYGKEYKNAYVRHALKTLEQFLKNMLTPIWIRDVPYNIKGKLSDKEASFYHRYYDNINIKFIKNQ